MGIKVLCAAAVVAIGIGHADAATVKLEFEHAFHGGDDLENTSFETYWGLLVGAVSEVYLELNSPVPNYLTLRTKDGTTIFSDLVSSGNGIYEGGTGDVAQYTEIFWDGMSGYVANYGEFVSYETFKDVRATLTAITEIAPVPLPATAVLLPMGLAALALMKKRRPKTT